MAKNLKWTEEELILALNLYLRRSRRVPRKTSWEAKELSSILNHLPIRSNPEREENFRTPDSVALKIENIKAKDPFFEQQRLEKLKIGMSKGGEGVVNLWRKYDGRIDEVSRDAEAILEKYRGNFIESLPVGRDDIPLKLGREYAEGARKLSVQFLIDRDRNLIRNKKLETLNRTGRLDCEVCGFNFYHHYGEIGRYFAECHHLLPIANGESTNTLADLAILCSNCHSMIHASKPPFSVAELRRIVHQNRREKNM